MGLRVTTLILGCSAYSCGFGVCCISLRASETFPRIVVMRFIFFPAWDISVLAEGSMAAKNYTKNKEQCVFISIYMYHLHSVLIPFFNHCCNSEVSLFLFCTHSNISAFRTCIYVKVHNHTKWIYRTLLQIWKKRFALTTQDSMWNKKCFLLVSSHILNIVHQIYKLLNHH